MLCGGHTCSFSRSSLAESLTLSTVSISVVPSSLVFCAMRRRRRKSAAELGLPAQ